MSTFYLICAVVILFLVGPAVVTGFLIGRQRACDEAGCAIGCGIGFVTFVIAVLMAILLISRSFTVQAGFSGEGVASMVLFVCCLVAVSVGITAMLARRLN